MIARIPAPTVCRPTLARLARVANAPPAAARYPLRDALVAYWPADETGGDLLDAHTGGYDLAQTGSVGYDTGHVSAHARAWASWASPATDWFEAALPALAPGDDESFSLVAWVYLDSLGPGATDYRGVVLALYGSTGYSLKAAYQGQMAWQAWQRDPAVLVTAHSQVGSLTTGAWHLVAAWLDLANQVMAVQVDDNDPVEAEMLNYNGRAENSFRVGRESSDGAHGRIEGLGLFNRALTAAELAWLYNGGDGRSYAETVACRA